MATGKVVAVLECGDQAYPQMLAAIESAKFHIRLSTYIFRTDDVGLQFIDALVRAHRRGVKTRVLIDGFGGGFLRSSAYHHLRRQGVPVSRFLHSTLPWKMPFLDLRLHKKSLVVDGDERVRRRLEHRRREPHCEAAESASPRHPFSRRGDDCPADRAGVRRRLVIYDRRRARWRQARRVRSPRAADRRARTIVAGPDQEVDQLVLVLLSAINLARRSIRVATPYFLPDEQLVTALQLAVLRGVDVHLVLPSHNNHRLVAWAAQTHVRPLLQSGCHLWRSAPPFDHSKLMTIDGSWSLIGSANWDMRSLRLNFELTVEFYDRPAGNSPESSMPAALSRSRWRKSTSARCREAAGCGGAARDALYMKAD